MARTGIAGGRREERLQRNSFSSYYIDLIFPASQHYRADPIPENSTLSPDERSMFSA